MSKMLTSLKFLANKRTFGWLALLVLVSLLVWQVKERLYIGPPPLITYSCLAGKSVLYSLSAKYITELTETSSGKNITAIDGYLQTEGKQWQYTVNGQPSISEAETYTCGGGEVITWELR